MKRRGFLQALGLLGVAGLGYSGHHYWPETGFSNPCLVGLPEHIRRDPLYQRIWQGIETSQVWDCHVHLMGTGDSLEEDAPWFSPKMDSYFYPFLYMQKRFYMNGGCVAEDDIDRSAIARLVALNASMPSGVKSMLYAFEWRHDENGLAAPERSVFHIPNSYASKVAKKYPHLFEWVASIHPYRPDAVEALHLAKADGAKAIKWLPQAMNIDPLSSKCHQFYQACVALKMPIISHAGRERALPSDNQHLGNPLRLRSALEAGVKVALAHCASDGEDVDLDQGEYGPIRQSFELFSRLMDTPIYEKLLYGELSALTLRNHTWAIKPLLLRQDWHQRLINGSDYPLPGIMPLIDTKSLHRQGLLDQASVAFLQAIKPYHPLLFDFALKRLLHTKDISFAPNVFHTRPFFES
jgi:uncharacterized protein